MSRWQTLGDVRNALGEGPWWCTSSQRLYWVDIFRGLVHRSTLDGTGHESWDVGEHVGFAIPGDDGSVIVGLRSGLSVLDTVTGEVRPRHPVEADRPEQRINDGKTDRRGRLWFGTMHDAGDRPVGCLYHYDGRSDPAAVRRSVRTSNGLAWSPSGDTFYFTDSLRYEITAFAYDVVSGRLGPPSIFARDTPPVLPDGLTVDADGYLWSAKWDGGVVVRYRPDGRIDRVIEVPVRRPTSCAFAGPDLTTMVITTAVEGDTSRAPIGDRGLAGAVLLLDVGARGIPEVPVRVVQSDNGTG